jgi:hypothetical protein
MGGTSNLCPDFLGKSPLKHDLAILVETIFCHPSFQHPWLRKHVAELQRTVYTVGSFSGFVLLKKISSSWLSIEVLRISKFLQLYFQTMGFQ